MKTQIAPCLILVTALLLAFLPAITVKAQINTIFVPDNYPTVQDAIGAAASGDTIFVRMGTYEGPLNQSVAINKTISLVGEGKETTKIHLNPPLVPMAIFTYEYMGYADALEINADNVKITGLTIDTLGGNINVNAAKTAIFGNNLHLGLTVNGDQTQIVDNNLNGSGIFLEGNNTTIARNTAVGRIEAKGTFELIAYNQVNGANGESIVTLRGNSSVVYSNTLESTNNWSQVFSLEYTSRDNLIAKNNFVGGGIEISPYTYYNTICGNNLNGQGIGLMGFNNLFYANQLNYVGIGGTHGGTVDAAYNVFYHNNFLDGSPEFQVWTKQPGPITWNNGEEGNYWSNYTGDGTAPYEVYGEYHYFDGAIREDTNVSLGQDIHPLLAPYDIQNLHVQLPAWAEQALQNTLQIPLNPPTPAPTPTSQENPPQTQTTPQPTQPPPTQPNPEQPPIPNTTAILIGGVLVLAGVIGLLSYHKQRKKVKANSDP